MGKKIKLSIVTATYNSGDTIHKLINIFKKNKNESVEWIIIDNNSFDNTIDLIQKNRDVIDIFITEKDYGIYDAWNKGVSISNGDYISFIGSDDIICDTYFKEALRAISEFPNHNIISFKISYIYGNKTKTLNASNYIKPNNFPVNLGFYHPGTIHSRELFIDNYFDVNFKIAGDREFLTRLYFKLNPIIINTDRSQIIHYHGGISTNKKFKIFQHKEVIKIILNIPNKNYIIFYNLILTYLKYFFIKIKIQFTN